MSHPFDSLDEEQLAAVCAPDDCPVVVLAGPGAGKTRVLTHRVLYLIDVLGYKPQHILVTTFTRKAAEELRTRLGLLIPQRQAQQVTATTIHGIGMTLIRSTSTKQVEVAKEYQVKKALQQIMKDSAYYTDEIAHQTQHVGYKWVDGWLDAAKLSQVPVKKSYEWFHEHITTSISAYAQMHPATDDPVPPSNDNDRRKKRKRNSEYRDAEMAKIPTELGRWFADCYQRLNNVLSGSGLITFADMLIMGYNIVKSDPERWQRYWRYVLNDEGQDSEPIQLDMLDLIAAHQRLFLVADSDQSLFRFRGATPELIEQYVRDHPTTDVHKIQTNYRSTATIVDHAVRLIGHSYDDDNKHMQKNLRPRPDAPVGTTISVHRFATDLDEAHWVSDEILSLLHDNPDLTPKDIFVIYRTNAQSQAIEDVFLDSRIPHSLSSGKGFWDRGATKDLLSYLKLSVNQSDDESFERIYNKASVNHPTPTRYLGKQFLDSCRNFGADYFTGMTVMASSGRMPPRWNQGVLDMMYQLRQVMTTSYPDKVNVVIQDYLSWKHREDGGGGEADDPLLDLCDVFTGVANRFDTVQGFLGHAERMAAASKRKNTSGVYCSTVHSAKGLEAKIVFGIGINDSLLPHWASGGTIPTTPTYKPQINLWLPSPHPGNEKDERCAAYVLTTRAIERLYLSWSVSQGTKINLTPSRFLTQLGVRMPVIDEETDNETTIVVDALPPGIEGFLAEVLAKGKQA